MKKSALVLLVAILLPSLGLGWLALRSTEEQRIILEKRTAELYQTKTDVVAAAARRLVEDQREAFAGAVQRLLAKADALRVATEFTDLLAGAWSQKAVGFAVGADSRLLCPTARDATQRTECQQFLWDNGAFLGNKIVATVYPVAAEELGRPDAVQKSRAQNTGSPPPPFLGKVAPPQPKTDLNPALQRNGSRLEEGGILVMRDGAATKVSQTQIRKVAPQQVSGVSDSLPLSQLAPATAQFRELISSRSEGMINRFVQDRLNMIFWLRRSDASGEFIFGCLIQAEDLRALWGSALENVVSPTASNGRPEVVVALLDDKGHPTATRPLHIETRDWKQPFVASEIGEALPHWEAALYLTKPEQLQHSARQMRRTLYLLIVAALSAIACGGWLVVADTRRQVALAKKKTDFVSNVSHELKTPLTSIRMFAELMQRGALPQDKREQYSRIIVLEAERLTRLINNVLDFARLDRRGGVVSKEPVDMHVVLSRVWDVQDPHLRTNGFHTAWESTPGPYLVVGNADALTQVFVNLLSNAEKYSVECRKVILRSGSDGESAYVSVLDRGSGVPAGEEVKIFQPFHRAHDSLFSGIEGTGLGLTLAQQLVRQQGGEITYRRRQRGGSEFTVRFPLAPAARPL